LNLENETETESKLWAAMSVPGASYMNDYLVVDSSGFSRVQYVFSG